MKYKSKQVIVEAITFDEFVEYGRNNGANIVNGMPWSFNYKGFPITHENDECYLIPFLNGTLRFTPQDMIITDENEIISACTIEAFKERYDADNGMGSVSDGYHTFDELYDHRMILFSIVCNSNIGRAWKSKLHDDGTMFDDYFIVGIKTKEGQYTYHYHMNNWDMFDVREVEFAPKWDGHKPSDITRLFSL